MNSSATVRGLVLLLAGAMGADLLTGCAAPSTPALSSPLAGSPEWSREIYFQQVAFSFERVASEIMEMPIPDPAESAIRLGRRRIVARGGAFFVRDRRHDLSPGSSVFVHRIHRAGETWLYRQGGLEIRWSGNDYFFVLEEWNSTFGIRWHCHRGLIELRRGREVVYRSTNRESGNPIEKTFSLPVTIQLDELGNLAFAHP